MVLTQTEYNTEVGKTKVLIQNKSVRPLVSIVIPVFNTALYLPACLNSVLNQTLTAIEIICIDDASVDESKRILENYAHLDSRIKIIYHNNNMGTLAARRHGVDIADGKYIMFLDSDDEFFPHACETAYNAIENNKTDVVRFGVEFLNYNKYDGRRKHFLTSEISPIEGRNLLWLWNEHKIKGWEMTNRIFSSKSCKDAYNQIEDGHFIMAEDLLFFFVYGYYTKTYSEIEDVLYKYRWGVGSYSGLEEVVDLNVFKKFLSEKNVFDSIKRFIENKKDYGDYSNILLKIRNHLLRDNILVWNNRLQKSEKEEGFALLIKSWGSKNVATAVKLLTDELQSNCTQLNSCCISLQKELDVTKKEYESVRCEYTKLKSESKEKEQRLQKAEENLKNVEQNLANANKNFKVIVRSLINTEEKLSDIEKMLKSIELKLKVAEQRFKIVKQKLKITEQTLRREKASWNYKIGYVVTWIPKKIYYFLKFKRG